jgi:hypothetical protein
VSLKLVCIAVGFLITACITPAVITPPIPTTPATKALFPVPIHTSLPTETPTPTFTPTFDTSTIVTVTPAVAQSVQNILKY